MKGEVEKLRRLEGLEKEKNRVEENGLALERERKIGVGRKTIEREKNEGVCNEGRLGKMKVDGREEGEKLWEMKSLEIVWFE